METLIDELHALGLLAAANAVPVIVAQLFRDRGATPLDFGHVMRDGERLFGDHKTWRGLASGTLAAALVAALMGLPAALGAAFGLLSLAADAASSAAKRRMHLRPGTEVLGLDQLGEALLPLIVFAEPLSLSVGEIVIVTISFVLLDTATARLRHRRWL
ncbi:MAG TPA: CDP-archaeol synthase [Steroidobacteraceae bacterium]